ncbi:MAG: hypothetical protein US52_C0029G0002 [candidate division WS6 bacterium GW2011_GWA2_37_6]|uniref:Uncharacterized protein n=1 Tax=candidate division WS6 bacterium GW2011_GWA2_37_6 TaxID=1619087 RepID=A0A0G0JEV1_9BACT|nr:MAG: hypothetical protein US52_C0029G0002 [candidate division WS6 bacterium GW2011_GWA2_37_6]
MAIKDQRHMTYELIRTPSPEFDRKVFGEVLPTYLGQNILDQSRGIVPLKEVGSFAGVGAFGNTEIYHGENGHDYCVINVLDYKDANLNDPTKMLTILEESVHYLHFSNNEGFRNLLGLPESMRNARDEVFRRVRKNHGSDAQILEKFIDPTAVEKEIQEFSSRTGIDVANVDKIVGNLSLETAKKAMADLVERLPERDIELFGEIVEIVGAKRKHSTTRDLSFDISYAGTDDRQKLENLWTLLLKKGYEDELVTSGFKADLISDSIENMEATPQELLSKCLAIVDDTTQEIELRALFNVYHTSPDLNTVEYDKILSEQGIAGLKNYVRGKLESMDGQTEYKDSAVERMRDSLQTHWRMRQRRHIAKAKFGMRMLLFDLDLPVGTTPEQLQESHPEYWRALMRQVQADIEVARANGTIDEFIRDRLQSSSDIDVDKFITDDKYSEGLVQEQIKKHRKTGERRDVKGRYPVRTYEPDAQTFTPMLNALQGEVSYQMTEAGSDSPLSDIEQRARKSRNHGNTDADILGEYAIHRELDEKREMLDWLMEPVAKVFTREIVKRMFPGQEIPEINLTDSYMYSRLLTGSPETLKNWLGDLKDWFDYLQQQPDDVRNDALTRFFQANDFGSQSRIVGAR